MGANVASREFKNRRVFRMNSRLGCGFSFRKGAETNRPWGARDVVDRCYILVYVLEGSGLYADANGNRFEIKPGTLFQRFPGVRHSSIFQPGADFRECYAILPPQIFELMLECNAASLKSPGFDIGLNPEAYAGFERLFNLLERSPESALASALSEAHAFAASLLSRRVQAGEDAVFVKKACSVLEKEVRGKPSTRDLAKRLGMSYSKFRQLFSRLTGMAPGEYRIKKRVELAQRMLAMPGGAIKCVAKELGYPDVHSFSKQFKLHAGLTPGQFAKSRRAGSSKISCP